MLIDKKYRLEPIVNPLENEKLQLMGFIEQKTISPEQIYDTQEFAKTISQEINSSNLYISLYIRSTGATNFNLGSANFRLNVNTGSLT